MTQRILAVIVSTKSDRQLITLLRVLKLLINQRNMYQQTNSSCYGKGGQILSNTSLIKGPAFEIKLFNLCEYIDYLWNSFLYSGRNENLAAEEKRFERHLGKSEAVIPRLMQDLFGQGYKLYVDNWYTSETLFRHLEDNGTAACGTAYANRLSLPDTFFFFFAYFILRQLYNSSKI